MPEFSFERFAGGYPRILFGTSHQCVISLGRALSNAVCLNSTRLSLSSPSHNSPTLSPTRRAHQNVHCRMDGDKLGESRETKAP